MDVAVLPCLGSGWDLHRELEVAVQLSHLGGTDDLNVVNLARVPVTLQLRVLASGRLLYCRDEAALADFTEGVIRRYCDFAPDLVAFYRDFDQGLAEEFLGDQR